MNQIRRSMIHVHQGELAVSAEPGTVLSAILGSCVATCLWDPVSKVGGMNHILLPGDRSHSASGNKYGVFAMEALINALMRQGARRSQLEAKAFGGASTISADTQIGESNARFVREFLQTERIPLIAESLGGEQARRVRFEPFTGRARQMLSPVNTWKPEPKAPRQPGKAAAVPNSGSGEVELF